MEELSIIIYILSIYILILNMYVKNKINEKRPYQIEEKIKKYNKKKNYI